MKIEDSKQKAAYITAIISFLIGWGLTIAGFCVEPIGEVSGSVLAILGEAMVYAASVFGVTMYFGSQMEKFKGEAREYMQRNNDKSE